MNAWPELAAVAGVDPGWAGIAAPALLAGIALAAAAAAAVRRQAPALPALALLEGLRLVAVALEAPGWWHAAATGLALILCAVLAGSRGGRRQRLAAALAATYLAGIAAFSSGGIAWAVTVLAELCRLALLLPAALQAGPAAPHRAGGPAAGPDPETGLDETGLDVTQLRDLLEAHRQAVALLSHELRGPLATLSAAAQSLEFVLAGSGEDVDARLARMRRSVARVDELAGQFMRRERLAERMLRPHHERVDLAELAREVVETLQPDAAHLLRIAPGAAAIGWCDRALCAEVLRNLVHNAIKYSPADQPVTIDAGQGPQGSAWISVADQGPGIAAEDLQQVFQRNYRSTAHRETRGTGQGLYLARQICQRQGGSLEVDSAPGQGARFTMRVAAGPQAANT